MRSLAKTSMRLAPRVEAAHNSGPCLAEPATFLYVARIMLL